MKLFTTLFKQAGTKTLTQSQEEKLAKQQAEYIKNLTEFFCMSGFIGLAGGAIGAALGLLALAKPSEANSQTRGNKSRP